MANLSYPQTGSKMELTQFTDRLKLSPLVSGVDFVPRGHARIETGFRYPDGSSIDVFIQKDDTLFQNHAPVRLTDFGNSLAWLNTLQIRPLKSKKREKLLKSVLDTYDIKIDGSALWCEIPEDQIETGIIRLGQACLRIADLVFTQRIVAQGSFEEEIEEIIAETQLDYQPKAQIIGRHGKTIDVDFKVIGKKTETAVFVLPSETKSIQTAHNKANDVFARCYDLRDWEGQRLAAWDDRNQIYRDEDINRIGDLAQVLPISDPAVIQQYLQAA